MDSRCRRDTIADLEDEVIVDLRCRGSFYFARNVEGDFDMGTLVIYFSQTGTTRAAAEKIAGIKRAGLVEIRPKRPYDMPYLKTVLTMLDALDLNGKHVAVFTTSGATKPLKLVIKLKKSYPQAKWHKELNANEVTEDEIKNWM